MADFSLFSVIVSGLFFRWFVRLYRRGDDSMIWLAFIFTAPTVILFYAGHAFGAGSNAAVSYRRWRMRLFVALKSLALLYLYGTPLVFLPFATLSDVAALSLAQGARAAYALQDLGTILLFCGTAPFKHLFFIEYVDRRNLGDATP